MEIRVGIYRYSVMDSRTGLCVKKEEGGMAAVSESGQIA